MESFFICEFCNNKINYHTKYSINIHRRFCKSYLIHKQNILNSITKDFLIKEYVINEKSCSTILTELTLNHHYLSYILNKLIEYDIHIRNASEEKKTLRNIHKS